jgi:NAD(P)-dependent dehydrogenase (short-subunit alcohol dehydrogenase family)
VTTYGITKLALAGLTMALARELGGASNWAAPTGGGDAAPARPNISVNGIAPGMVDSNAGKSMAGEGSPVRERIEQMVAKRGAGQREDLVGALLLLVSPAGDWMTGQVLHVDGGWIIRP